MEVPNNIVEKLLSLSRLLREFQEKSVELDNLEDKVLEFVEYNDDLAGVFELFYEYSDLVRRREEAIFDIKSACTHSKDSK
jgi:biopolymer transport protein ExbB/TolQ